MKKYEINPKDKNELNLDLLNEIAFKLDEGAQIIINPENWQNKPNSSEEDQECDCPVCRAKRDTIAKFAGKYSAEQIENFLDSDQGGPAEVIDFAKSRVEEYLTEEIDDILGDMLADIPKDQMIHISELQKVPTHYTTRSIGSPITIEYIATRRLPADWCIILEAPTILKILKPDVIDYLIVGNFDNNVATNLKKSTENYRFNQELTRRLRDKIFTSSGSSILAKLLSL